MDYYSCKTTPAACFGEPTKNSLSMLQKKPPRCTAYPMQVRIQDFARERWRQKVAEVAKWSHGSKTSHSWLRPRTLEALG